MNLLATQNHHQNHLKHPSKATNQWHLPKSEKQKLNFNTTYHFTQSVQSASLHITLPLRKSEAPHTWSGVARRFSRRILSRRSSACRGRERWVYEKGWIQAHFGGLVSCIVSLPTGAFVCHEMVWGYLAGILLQVWNSFRFGPLACTSPMVRHGLYQITSPS